MEPLWSPVVATGGNRSQIRRPRNPPKQAETIAVRCDRLPATFHGEEGVDGSSPSEGSAKAPHVGAFSFRPTCSLSNVQRVWSRLWSFRVRECPAGAGSYAGYSVMLTGDSNKPCWERVVGYYEGREDETGVEVLKAQNLHASHHGSRTFVKDAKDDPEPYLEAFELIDSEDVIISVGPDSKHDHPHEDMLDIYNDQVGAENVLQTCVEGVCASKSCSLRAMFTHPVDLTFA